ncbi:MAG: RsmB/NOP family class I SAM-dependent RNA methyltransferase [Paracoccaceae bacterium]
MTPAARCAAAIAVLDRVGDGEAAEKALTGWARASRYAGSGDRAAVRDIVFSVLRCKRSAGAAGAGTDGRALVLGLLRQQGRDPEAVFTGSRYAPGALSDAERTGGLHADAWPDPVRLDYPDWLDGRLRSSLGKAFTPVMEALRSRAPVFLRANTRRATRDSVRARLAAEGIDTRPHALADSALEVTGNARRIAGSGAYRDGLAELQDVASQAVVDALALPESGRVLDYCAGGGGKALAIAARSEARVFAHDVNPARMRDLPVRARRAGVEIPLLEPGDLSAAGLFEMVFCDVPCSGSGAWRRAPGGKWTLDESKLTELEEKQRMILDRACRLVAQGGTLAYATCSLLDCENADPIRRFLRDNTNFSWNYARVFTPLDGGDGMFVASLKRV